MKSRYFVLSVSALALFGVAAPQAMAKVIYDFPAGSYPYGRVALDSAGTIYGTTYQQNGDGTVFDLKERHGAWTPKTLYSFGGSDGANPVAGLFEDHTTGVFYGTTVYGGRHNDGTVFSLAPSGTQWVQQVLYDFAGSSDGAQPQALLARDQATGALFGTTWAGGAENCGTVFVLTPSGGSWSFQNLHSFQGGTDGCNSVAQLKPGPKAGTWIGATLNGGSANAGTIFKLSERNGVWSETPVYSFAGSSDGRNPYDLDAGSDGTIYGVTEYGGAYGYGVAFEMTPVRSKFRYSVIYSFSGGYDGANPAGILLNAKTGVLFGTTDNGGYYGGGTVFALTPNGTTWTKTIVHDFGSGHDGAHPASRPTQDPKTGRLYGTTPNGGAYSGGTVYQVTP